MIEQTPWIERTFDFGFPVGHFPLILERLRGTPARIEELFRFYPARIHSLKRGASWSMQEHAGHLSDLDELHDGRLDDFLSSRPVLRAADMSNRKTSEANHNSRSIESVLLIFRGTRQRFVYRLENLQDEALTQLSQHPRLGVPMRLIDMAYFVAEHDDHHLARIRSTAKAFL